MKLFYAPILFIFGFLNVIAQNKNIYEAPHVFYHDKGLVIQSVIDGKLIKDSVWNNVGTEIKVSIPDHPDWSFSVQLRKSLTVEPSVSAGADKMVFISDIEGEFSAFRSLLLAAKVIDGKYNWIYGKGKLIICGDLFDRGKDVTQVLWLLYKLEQEAVKNGGYIHTILGNHDIMNLSGDTRYLDPKYLEITKTIELNYTDFYTNNTELGRWLRSKNIIEKIGDNLCAHAGISPQVNALGLSLVDINNRCRPYYDKAKSTKNVGKKDGANVDFFFSGSSSLFWYRGYFKEPKATEASVDSTLNFYNCKRIIVGHTIVPDNVGFYYGGKVLGLDVNQHKNDHEMALFENKKWYKINELGKKTFLKVK